MAPVWDPVNKWHQVSDLHLHNIIITVIKIIRVYFSAKDFSNIQLVCKDFANMVPKVLCWLWINFSPMRKPRLGYEKQNHINPHCIEMASMAMNHFGLNPLLLSSGWIHRPLSRCSLHSKCGTRSRHSRKLQTHKANIAWWMSSTINF